ncbi:Glycosyl transferase group 1 [uncultured Mycobacterium sp.]|uniref:Glycosyl transferase group 1 n=1 Tax=uncultured Mycobacterium sp. TaxID=171292 RepID=A0A1Y5PEH7_9MYCO|nr:Glycosyl transferase group 1 [uncultured Mycobacterium sp.]
MTDISFFVRSMSGGGAQRAMVRLATGFAELGHNVEVLTLEPEGVFAAELSPAVKVTALSSTHTLGAIPALARYLRHRRPAAMVTTEPGSNIALTIAKLCSGTQCRIMLREGLFPSIHVKENPYRSTRLALRLAPLVYRHADVIVAVATEMATDLARFARLDPQRITTIAVNPVVTPALAQAAADKPAHPWFDDDIPIVLGVGRIDQGKDFTTLLKAFTRIRDARPCRLLILGDGPALAELESARAASQFADDIALPGFSLRPYPEMANCSVFVLSSRYEGQPNVLIEALACGAPVVATDCPSGPREILKDGRYGRLVPVGDDVAMAEAITATLDMPIDRELSKARGYDFTLANSTALYLAALFPATPQHEQA